MQTGLLSERRNSAPGREHPTIVELQKLTDNVGMTGGETTQIGADSGNYHSLAQHIGYVVLRWPFGPPDTVLAPTRRVMEVEDPWLQLPNAANYFDAAWLAGSGFTVKAPASHRAPDCAHASERRSALFSEGETSQILSDAFTGRLYESFAEGPVSVEQLRPGSRSREGNQGGVPLWSKCRCRNGHEIRYCSAPFDVDADGGSRHRDGDAAAGVAYAELHCSASILVIKIRLSVYANREAQCVRRTCHHRSQQGAQSGVGSGEGPTIGFETEAGRTHSFVLAEIFDEIWAAARVGDTEPKNEFVLTRQHSRFDGEFRHNVNAEWLGRRTLQRPSPRKFPRWRKQGPDEGIDSHSRNLNEPCKAANPGT